MKLVEFLTKDNYFAEFEATQGKNLLKQVLNLPKIPLQLYAYYCGPATVTLLLAYHNYQVTQTQLASFMGTTSAGTHLSQLTKPLNKLNARFSDWWYWECYRAPNFEKFLNRITFNLFWREPAILLVYTNPPTGSPFKLPGYTGNYKHYIVTYGKRGQLLYYADTHQDVNRGAGQTYGKHHLPASYLYKLNEVAGGWMVC